MIDADRPSTEIPTDPPFSEGPGVSVRIPGEPAYVSATREAYDVMVPGYLDLVRGELERNVFGRAVLASFAELVRDGAGGGGGSRVGRGPDGDGGGDIPGADGAGGGEGIGEGAGVGPVVEVGSGPGRITAHLASLGLDVRGVDLSPAMVATARAAHPGLRFEVGNMTCLDLPDGSLLGLVAWYSLIHIPPEDQAGVLAEFHRVLAPGGHLLLAFQMGPHPVHYDEAFGHRVSLDFHRLDPDRLTGQLESAGFGIRARLERAPEGAPTWQGHLVARKLPEPDEGEVVS